MTDVTASVPAEAYFTAISIRCWDLGGTGHRYLFRPAIGGNELAMIRAHGPEEAKEALALAYLRFVDATRELSPKRIAAAIARLGEPIPLNGRSLARQWVQRRLPE
jgi:hypothetical protein